MTHIYLNSTVLFLIALLVACSEAQTNKSEVSNHASAPVTVAYVVQKDVPVQISSIANVEAYSTVSVKSQVKGKLAEVYFEEGQEVKKGELIFLIDPRPFKAALRQAEANLARDTAMANDAKSTASRYAELLKKGIVSEQQYEQSLTTFKALSATVKAGEASVENAKLQLEYCYIRSPIDGRLGELRVDPGNIVEENQTIMAIINQIKPIYVSFTVPEQNLLEIRKHMASTGKLKVEVTNPTEKSNPVSGELTFLNNEVDTTTGTIMLKALFPNEDELLWPGKFVNVALTLTTLYNAVVIPSQAVQTGQEGEYVFVVKPDLTVESRPVILGSRLEQDVVVEEGLDVQEKVVTNGQYDLSPGIKVEIKNSIESNSQNNSGTKKANEKHLKNL